MDCEAAEDEATLLRMHARGDKLAFGRLYDRFDRPCFDFIRRMLHPPDDAAAEDVHQETWLAVARSGCTFDPGKSRFVTWLFTVARNKLMDHLRTRSHLVLVGRDEDVDTALDGLTAAETEAPERLLDASRLGADIVRAVSKLPERQRETFILFALEDLSLAEVADVTGVGIETAKTRLRYARARLRQDLVRWEQGHA
jgi:RNA polymerase sigma factor (sigma-70 family)